MRTHRLPLDDVTADRLAAGRVDPGDAPPGYADVAAVLSELRSAPAAAVDPDPELLGALVQAIGSRPRTERSPAVPRRRLTKIAALASMAVLSTAGMAAAATGNLPDPAQDAVSDVVSRVGIDLPATGDDRPERDEDRPTTGNVDNPSDRDAHGVEVSGTARTTEATGRAKGQEVSEAARDGHGRRGGTEDDGTDEDETTSTTVDDDGVGDRRRGAGKPEDTGAPAQPGAPVTVPSNAGGSGTDDGTGSGRGGSGSGRSDDDAGEHADDDGSHSGSDDHGRGRSSDDGSGRDRSSDDD